MIIRVFVFAALCSLFYSCLDPNAGESAQSSSWASIHLQGETMGTSYNIRYLDSQAIDYHRYIKGLLADFNSCVNTYDSSSVLGMFNASGGLTDSVSGTCGDCLFTLLESSAEVHAASNAQFDPTIGPLIQHWGFYQNQAREGDSGIDSAAISELLDRIGFENVLSYRMDTSFHSAQDSISKTLIIERSIDQPIQLDFNAIAKGYGVDLISVILEANGVENYMVEIGGELRTRGKNAQGKAWTIGLEAPKVDSREVHRLLFLGDAGVASSGNYRNYLELNGQRYGHSVNPLTGYPALNRLLSVTVVHKDKCYMADAYATAFMLMGLESSLRLVEDNPDLEAYFISSNAQDASEFDITQSSGFAQYLQSDAK
jgi:thiamine biosynthesis lipoprotein